MKKVVLALIAVFVAAPTAVVVLLATLLSPLSLAFPKGRGDIEPFTFVVLTLLGGWLGLAALVRLCAHYSRSDQSPRAPEKAAAGLLCGTAAAVTLMGAAAHPFQFPTVLLLGPLLAAAVLGYLLWMSWPATLKNAEAGPLRRALQSHAHRLQLMAVFAVVLVGLVVLIIT